MNGFWESAPPHVELGQELIRELSLLQKQMEVLAMDKLTKLKSAKSAIVRVSSSMWNVILITVRLYFQMNIDIQDEFNWIHNVVHCEWNDWVLGECSKSCGGGLLTQTRQVKVGAEYGGKECSGVDTLEVSCNVDECPGKYKQFWIHNTPFKIVVDF